MQSVISFSTCFNQELRENSSAAKKDTLEHVQSHWKGSGIYRSSRSTTQNFLRRPTMVTNTFEDFEPSSKKFLATPLRDSPIIFLPN